MVEALVALEADQPHQMEATLLNPIVWHQMMKTLEAMEKDQTHLM